MKTSLFLALLAGCAHHPLDQFKELTGGDRWDSISVMELEGKLSVGGLSGAYTLLENVRDGRYLSRYELGPIKGADGFDGEKSWNLNAGGEVSFSDGAEAVAIAKTSAWMTSLGYWRSSGASLSEPAIEERGGKRLIKIEARPDGGVPIELFFDGGLLVETRHKQGQDTIIATLSDYRDAGGIRIPFTRTIDSGDPRNLISINFEKARLLESSDELFARSETDSSKVTFAGDRKVEIPMELVNNHIYVNAAIDGKPVRLLVDTGGANIVTPKSAAKLGLAVEGKMAARGVGEKEVDVGYAKVGSLELGGVKIADPLFAVLDLGPLENVEGIEFDGLVGFEVFHRFAVRIDYPASRLTLIDPKEFTPPKAHAVRFELDEQIPIVAGEIDGIAARITIDTGSRSSLSAYSPFTKQNDLIGKYRPSFETVTGWGVGGPLSSWPVRISKVKLGDVEVTGVLGDLYTGSKGAFADPSVSANLGGGILRKFIVTFDYENRIMHLEPGPELGARDAYDRVGVWIMRDGDKLEIGAVTPKSPAEKAGLAVGDRIVSIDGAPASSKPLPEWRAYFKRDPGTKMSLKLERKDGAKEVGIVLEELVP